MPCWRAPPPSFCQHRAFQILFPTPLTLFPTHPTLCRALQTHQTTHIIHQVSHADPKSCSRKTNRRSAGFTDEERGKMTELLAAGFCDTFRRKHPDLEGAYTWWSYRSNARDRNIGWRIDYFLVSERFMSKVEETAIYPDITGSDHCPVGLTLKIAGF